jgi:hypothetical protein
VALQVGNKTNTRVHHGKLFYHISSAVALGHAACNRHAMDQEVRSVLKQPFLRRKRSYCLSNTLEAERAPHASFVYYGEQVSLGRMNHIIFAGLKG